VAADEKQTAITILDMATTDPWILFLYAPNAPLLEISISRD
jgi:hypothetical protein